MDPDAALYPHPAARARQAPRHGPDRDRLEHYLDKIANAYYVI
jgi:hypothetical protein